jgi:dienelactone hydrolase
MVFMQRRADDVNAGVEWLRSRPDVNPACIANTGWSHGGVTALLASGKRPALYRATVAHAPGVWGGGANAYIGMEELIRAGMKLPTPILVQSNTTDNLVFVELNRILVRELQRWGRAIEYKEYTHSGGHNLFNLVPDLNPTPGLGPTEKFQIWGADATPFLERALAGCVR